ncbi:DUF6233 domain-containing protein [Streptomyces sp. OV198]|uniref:DUF6233 domain-containing protein n=1 Tax=Streptomyces sp. OV198 TaxID=1882787 RepID=UPI00211BCA82|nr:DUF6233 domain-containing protein [Streptomyces sp. OV198]
MRAKRQDSVLHTPCSLDNVDSTECGCGTPCGCSASTPRSPLSGSRKPNRNRAKRTGLRSRTESSNSAADARPSRCTWARCYAAGKRRRPVPRDEARRLLTSGVRACTHCKPDAQLRILDQLGACFRRPPVCQDAALLESAWLGRCSC